jgi:hypothetical protein
MRTMGPINSMVWPAVPIRLKIPEIALTWWVTVEETRPNLAASEKEMPAKALHYPNGQNTKSTSGVSSPHHAGRTVSPDFAVYLRIFTSNSS